MTRFSSWGRGRGWAFLAIPTTQKNAPAPIQGREHLEYSPAVPPCFQPYLSWRLNARFVVPHERTTRPNGASPISSRANAASCPRASSQPMEGILCRSMVIDEGTGSLSTPYTYYVPQAKVVSSGGLSCATNNRRERLYCAFTRHEPLRYLKNLLI